MARSDIATVIYKPARAIELRKAGLPYYEIATELGYANRSSAWRAVNKALSDRVPELADDFLHFEIERLDAIQSAYWDAAITDHDYAAANIVIDVIRQRARILGLDSATRKKQDRGGPRSILAPPTYSPNGKRPDVRNSGRGQSASSASPS